MVISNQMLKHHPHQQHHPPLFVFHPSDGVNLGFVHSMLLESERFFLDLTVNDGQAVQHVASLIVHCLCDNIAVK